jgi:hypothetical protein
VPPAAVCVRHPVAATIERLVDDDDWFVREVEKELAQIERDRSVRFAAGRRGDSAIGTIFDPGSSTRSEEPLQRDEEGDHCDDARNDDSHASFMRVRRSLDISALAGMKPVIRAGNTARATATVLVPDRWW